MFTWLLSPLEHSFSISCRCPTSTRAFTSCRTLPADYQAEVKRLITATQKENIVGQLQARAEQQARSMFFFKWYGKDQPSFANVPSFYEKYNFVKTIGVSVFNKKNSTSKHFGPMRATIRVLYNINDMNDRTAYIWCGDTTSYWKDDKLFIFDDTLMHQSVNQTDQTRYCLFVDILRPSYLAGSVCRHRFVHGRRPQGQQFDLLQELEGHSEVAVTARQKKGSDAPLFSWCCGTGRVIRAARHRSVCRRSRRRVW